MSALSIGGSTGEDQPSMLGRVTQLGRVTHDGACTKLSW